MFRRWTLFFIAQNSKQKNNHTVNGRDSRKNEKFGREGEFMPLDDFFVRCLFFPTNTLPRPPPCTYGHDNNTT